MDGLNMKAFFRHTLLALCFTPALYIEAQASTQPPATGGIIHFHGQIVEGGCMADPAGHNVKLSCYRDGARSENSIPVRTLARGEQQQFEDATLNMEWVNEQKTLAVISIQYR